jgi:hypothetical protein
LAYVPLGHDDTHVAVAGARSSGGVQLRQLVALAVQVAQLVLQMVHTLLGPMKVPAGHALTHTLPLRNGWVPVGLQAVQALGPVAKHVWQVVSHARQLCPFE